MTEKNAHPPEGSEQPSDSRLAGLHEREITPWDEHTYQFLTCSTLTPEQEILVCHPEKVCPRETDILAIHWHPETVPLSLAKKRLAHMFPNCVNQLVIPTQHNELMTCDEFSGVEIDSHSPEFHRKIQLLLHFKAERARNAHALHAMIAHTRKYRQSQLFELLDYILEEKYNDAMRDAAEKTGAEDELVQFLRLCARKVKKLLDKHLADTPDIHIKNKLLYNYINMTREFLGSHVVHRVIILLQHIKAKVKKGFELDYFYETREIIEEVRSLGGGVVIPHPEQFWPVLLSDYDVDGIEVWNPQSREFTEFLIQVILRKNKTEPYKRRPLLIMTGDDAHLGEKLLPPEFQNPEKIKREVGYQPVWDEPSVRKTLSLGGVDKESTIREYRNRLIG